MVALKHDGQQKGQKGHSGKQERRGGIETGRNNCGSGFLYGSRNDVVALKLGIHLAKRFPPLRSRNAVVALKR